MAIGLDPAPRKQPQKAMTRSGALETIDPTDHLTRQLDVLRTMFDQKKDDDYYANFDYVSQRSLFTMKNRRPSEFGDVRIYTPKEMLSNLFAKSNVPTTIDWRELEE